MGRIREDFLKRCKTLLMVTAISFILPMDAMSLPIAAGDDIFPSIGEIEITTIANPFGIPVFNETIALSSMGTLATVHRDDQVGNTIDTEIISLDLFGTSTNVQTFPGPREDHKTIIRNRQNSSVDRKSKPIKSWNATFFKGV